MAPRDPLLGCATKMSMTGVAAPESVCIHLAPCSCSKLMMLLVNVSLKFQTLISEICQYFLLKKCVKLLKCKSFSHFSTKNISAFGYKVVKHLMS